MRCRTARCPDARAGGEGAVVHLAPHTKGTAPDRGGALHRRRSALYGKASPTGEPARFGKEAPARPGGRALARGRFALFPGLGGAVAPGYPAHTTKGQRPTAGGRCHGDGLRFMARPLPRMNPRGSARKRPPVRAVGRWPGGAARCSPGWGDTARPATLLHTPEEQRPTAGGRCTGEGLRLMARPLPRVSPLGPAPKRPPGGRSGAGPGALRAAPPA